MDSITELHPLVEGHHLMDARVQPEGSHRDGRERNLLALPTLDMYLPLSKFESIH